jgi:hypothetical protein
MAKWRVYKYVKENDKCPFDEWYDARALTDKDRAKLDARVNSVESLETIPPEWVKKYRTTEFYELKVKGDKKQLRPLCIKLPDKKILLMCGAVEKGGKIPKGDLTKAQNLINDYTKDLGNAQPYYEDEEDLE